MTFPRTHSLLTRGLAERAYPAVVCEVGRASGPLWRDALGHLSYDVDARPCEVSTIFDLASLTKVIATTSLVGGQWKQTDGGEFPFDLVVTDNAL